MTTLFVLGAAAVLIAALFLYRAFRTGYRGAIGFKNFHPTEIAAVNLVGFSKPIGCRTLGRGEHSFNYVGSQSIPDEVTITWSFVGDTAERTALVSLVAVPKEAKNGELFFVLSDAGSWDVAYAPELQLEKLQRGE